MTPAAGRAGAGRWALALTVLACAPLHAQEIRGRVLEATVETPVAYAGVFLLDAERDVRATVLADSLGRFVLRAPGAGEYYLLVQRLGYFETESPLVAVSDDGRYRLDVEVRPEPIRLDPLLVTVRNEELERWYTQALGGHPNAIRGFRVIQGARLEEARMRAKDNTDLLRWLYVPVSHGLEACLGHRMPPVDRYTGAIGEPSCGTLYVDGFPVPTEHLETVDKSEIAVVVLLPPSVEIFTYGFDWSARPSRTR